MSTLAEKSWKVLEKNLKKDIVQNTILIMKGFTFLTLTQSSLETLIENKEGLC